MNKHNDDTVHVIIRDNEGEDRTVDAHDLESARAIAKQYRIPDHHMVCIEVNQERVLRWDRQHIVGFNHWRSTDLNEMETLGPIRIIRRR